MLPVPFSFFAVKQQISGISGWRKGEESVPSFLSAESIFSIERCALYPPFLGKERERRGHRRRERVTRGSVPPSLLSSLSGPLGDGRKENRRTQRGLVGLASSSSRNFFRNGPPSTGNGRTSDFCTLSRAGRLVGPSRTYFQERKLVVGRVFFHSLSLRFMDPPQISRLTLLSPVITNGSISLLPLSPFSQSGHEIVSLSGKKRLTEWSSCRASVVPRAICVNPGEKTQGWKGESLGREGRLAGTVSMTSIKKEEEERERSHPLGRTRQREKYGREEKRKEEGETKLNLSRLSSSASFFLVLLSGAL